ncbi:DNA primase noncatalytic subunit PriX [Candidatus Acidianus copahuensis]|uniref:Primase X domain-containing protein n=1 Tax=Candidatus Acidianus copahuensis TaxID=1160895 RepID=A0A031LKD8_9CREN|nr:hypothetical protein CM19_11135 [Candidatus Acidianus copahuensis]
MPKRTILHYPDDTNAGYTELEDGITRVFNENDEFLFEVDGIFPPRQRKANYDWVEKVLDKGLNDGRKRFILYVASRYLVNVKGLNEEEAVKELEDFYYKTGNGKIYDTWLRSVVRGVKTKGFMPPSLKKLQEKDPKLYEEIVKIL